MSTKGKSTKHKSPYIGLSERDSGARRAYEPSHIYRFLFDNTDRHGVLLYGIMELADTAVVHRHLITRFIADMKTLGYMEDFHGKPRLLFKPSEIEWNEELYQKLDELRKTHFTSYRNNHKKKTKKKESK